VTTLASIRKNANLQIALGLLVGICFGFLLQKGGATDYGIIEGQLLLTDFTVLRLMLSAVIAGMVLFQLLKRAGLAESHAASGTAGSNMIGGLVFGAGFALLGYCPGTVAGAAGTGALDALVGGIPGLLIGAGLFADVYPAVKDGILARGPFPAVTVSDLLRLNEWVVIVILEACMTGFLLLLAYAGF